MKKEKSKSQEKNTSLGFNHNLDEYIKEKALSLLRHQIKLNWNCIKQLFDKLDAKAETPFVVNGKVVLCGELPTYIQDMLVEMMGPAAISDAYQKLLDQAGLLKNP